MLKSYRAALIALLLLLLVHLQPVYRVCVDGQWLTGLYTGGQIRLANEAAEAAADELLPGEAALPVLRKSLRVRLRRPAGNTAVLSDALLLSLGEVRSADAVSVNGAALGSVADGEALLDALRLTIRSDMPVGAAVGNLGGRLQVFPVYTRAGLERSKADMLAEILAAAPVFYLDSGGKCVESA
ncbi:MAG: hypothetical protein IKO83_00865 [Oscillospiraceae bacterium]|nr:hypothetical protein [Oscillospiraceae bacterium]